ncbi:IstB-like ATP binding protein, partial [Sinomicrobium oceani]
LKGLDHINRQTLMEIIEDRHGKRSTIMASQLPIEAWHQTIGEQTIADAILDRLVHTAHRINIKGESMRKKLRNKS